MRRVLIVKTSSMGDVLHTLPALTDAVQVFPNITFDWVVEEGFAQIRAGTLLLTASFRLLSAAGGKTGSAVISVMNAVNSATLFSHRPMMR